MRHFKNLIFIIFKYHSDNPVVQGGLPGLALDFVDPDRTTSTMCPIMLGQLKIWWNWLTIQSKSTQVSARPDGTPCTNLNTFLKPDANGERVHVSLSFGVDEVRAAGGAEHGRVEGVVEHSDDVGGQRGGGQEEDEDGGEPQVHRH